MERPTAMRMPNEVSCANASGPHRIAPNDALKSVMSFPANGARARVSPNFIGEVGGRGLLGLTSQAPSLLVWMDWVSQPQLRFGWVTNVLTNCIPG